MRRSWVWGSVLATLGCNIGGRVDRFAPAKRPEGVAVTLALLGGGRAQGELLAVQDTALVVLARDTVTLVPYRALEAGEFSQVGELRATPPAPDFARRLQLVSRFPQGLTPGITRAGRRSPPAAARENARSA